MKKILSIVSFLMLFMALSMGTMAAPRAQEVSDEVVVVIDPGHGGENLGTQSGHTIEKEMTLITAKAMLQELEKFENIKVYMTHSEDHDVSFPKRAEVAANVNADFLYSIHYNASENHTMFGSEVWVSSEMPFNAYGYQFGYEHLQAMAQKGLYIRGVKCRINDEGTDYYAILRESAARNIPAVIIEHCYVDEDRDAEFIKNEECYRELGRLDAHSVAKYFGLKSTELGVDYSETAQNLQGVDVNSRVAETLIDRTSPDICEIELSECDYETGEVSLLVRAADYDSMLLYYNYSLDNGATWSKWECWPGADAFTGAYQDTFRLNLQILEKTRPNILVRAYNKSDLYSTSNLLSFDQSFGIPSASDTTEASAPSEVTPATEPVEREHKTIGTTTFLPVFHDEENASPINTLTFLKFCLAFVIVLFLIVLTTQIVQYQAKKKRRRRK